MKILFPLFAGRVRRPRTSNEWHEQERLDAARLLMSPAALDLDESELDQLGRILGLVDEEGE